MQFRLVLSALFLAPMAQAGQATATPPPASLAKQLNALKQQLAEQQKLIDSLARELAAQRDKQASLAARVLPGAPAVGIRSNKAEGFRHNNGRRGEGDFGSAMPVEWEALAAQRGAGAASAGQQAADPVAAEVTRAAGAVGAAGAKGAQAGSASGAAVQNGRANGPNGARPATVGQAPQRDTRPPEVAPLFEQPGVLTPKGKLVIEPSLQYGYSSSNRVALVGYTVIPALLIGLVDVRELKRNTTTASLSLRTGLSRRLEIEARVPYVYRSDATVSREIFTGTAVERVFDTSGHAVGDAEIGLRYQLNAGGADQAYYLTGLRVKSRTGKDPFSVVTDCTRRCIGPNATGTGLPLTLPTGSGFYAVQPSLTALFPSDPAVFFGSISYLHNFKRSNVSRKVLGGESEFLGEIEPGGIAGFNIGMGLGLNDKASFSIGYDHSSVGRTRQNGMPVPGSVRTQLGTMVLGYSYRLNDQRSLSVAIGAGLTRDTPDVSLTLRMPVSW